MEEYTATINRIIFHNSENGYCVSRVKFDSGDDGIIVGTMPYARLDLKIKVFGEWIVDRKFGKQFKFSRWEEVLPDTTVGILNYLSSGLIKGIGPVFAKKIVGTFGKDTLSILDDKPEKLLDIPGVGKKRVQMIVNALQEQKEVRQIMIFLKEYNISNSLSAKIYKEYGDNSIQILKENPYRLADDITGIGFKKADEIAMSVGLAFDCRERIRSGILFCLQKTVEEGNTFLPFDELVKRSSESSVLDIGKEKIAPVAQEMIKYEELVDDNGRIYLPKYYRSELNVAKRINILLESANDWSGDKPYECDNIDYSEEQLEAINKALKESLFILTGGPGTGKTTTTLGIINAFINANKKVLLAAPTGRAAKRMSEATGREAKTIHRLLEFSIDGFAVNEDAPLDCDAVIIDESSMVDILLMNALLKGLKPGTKLILVGDIDQLPSVGAGNVLRDMINSGTVPVITLKTIFRQALGSDIITAAHSINSGIMPRLLNDKDLLFYEMEETEYIQQKILDLVSEIPENYKYDVKDIQVLSPMRRSWDPIGSVMLNERLQFQLNENTEHITRGFTKFYLGDKVMQMKNNYDLDVFNGDIGYITAVDSENNELDIDFYGKEVHYKKDDLDELDLAYATTVHKSQGSEFPVVIFPVHKSHYILAQRNLLYTAITRAKKLCILVGTKDAMRMMIGRQPANERYTFLSPRIGGWDNLF